ncbi:MAG TPA: glycogen synthase GlgA [Gammaproteobacteria bacterium]|nr:glycogen synthase GlgA [Gammaproteobacteria bacterium]
MTVRGKYVLEGDGDGSRRAGSIAALRSGAEPAEGRRGAALKVLMVSAECYPLAKTGGLADVCTGLALSLLKKGLRLRLLVPGYDCVFAGLRRVLPVAEIAGLPAPAKLLASRIPGSSLRLWILDSPELFRRRGIYQNEAGEDWPDNFRRFAALGMAAARIAEGRVAGLRWRPDLVHCHDWCAGLTPLLLAGGGVSRPASIFTIHNASFQGNFPLSHARDLGLPANTLGPEGAEFYGRFSFLKAGVRYADAVSTVSPRYSREIRSPEFGCGMEGLFAAKGENLVGILNGVDTQLWNPATDRWISRNYSAAHPAGKARCKLDLQRRLGLDADPRAPLGIFVCRLTAQKMADILLGVLPALLALHPRLQFTLHGCGERRFETGFTALAARFPGRVAVRIGYDEALAHRLQAGGDFLFHGCRFEPCGLVQQYAMRYGTLPIVRRTGGLADTVSDRAGGRETGFFFEEPTANALAAAAENCLRLYAGDRLAWKRRQRNAMEEQPGWESSSQAYLRLYQRCITERRAIAGRQ